MEQRTIPQFLIAAPSSNSGKTTICWGLMAYLTKKKYKVQPYKCGPDYIDTKFHTDVCGRPSVNLDTFMASAGHTRGVYASYAADADVCIVEGMMGLYDGYDRDRGSSAEVAGVLDIPVVLVVDAASMAYSVAPLLKGFLEFRQDVHIAGVIFNKVGSGSHFSILKGVCDDFGVPCFGYMLNDRNPDFAFTSRYLGLDFTRKAKRSSWDYISDKTMSHIDWEAMLKATARPLPAVSPDPVAATDEKMRIAVARNAESFCFIYQEHLDLLHRLGTVTFFDPERDAAMPAGTDLLYLPGGYPEKHAPLLSKNKSMLRSVREYIEAGGKTLAECGGMIYLAEDLKGREGAVYNLAGALPIRISAADADRRLTLGYRQFDFNGMKLRGHEFHYTQQTGGKEAPASAAQVFNARGGAVDTPVYRYKNLIASYTHLYWGELDLLNLFK